MELEAKLEFLEDVLQKEKGTIGPQTALAELDHWDSLTMLNLQMELMIYNEEIRLEDIRACSIVEDLCRIIP